MLYVTFPKVEPSSTGAEIFSFKIISGLISEVELLFTKASTVSLDSKFKSSVSLVAPETLIEVIKSFSFTTFLIE